jgi:hypothetical protein
MRYVVAWFCILTIAGCVQTQIAPSPLAPTVNADPFTDRFYDCNGIDTAPALSLAVACSDAFNTGSCLRQHAKAGVSPDTLACAVGDALLAAYAQTKLAPNDARNAARADALQLWLRHEGLILNNKWCR